MSGLLGWLAILNSWLALYLCGRKRIGWLLAAACTFLWIPYGLMIHAWPVIINTIVYGIVSLNNYRTWDTRGNDNVSSV